MTAQDILKTIKDVEIPAKVITKITGESDYNFPWTYDIFPYITGIKAVKQAEFHSNLIEFALFVNNGFNKIIEAKDKEEEEKNNFWMHWLIDIKHIENNWENITNHIKSLKKK